MKRHIKLKKKSRKYEKKRLIVTEMRKNKKPRVKSTERKIEKEKEFYGNLIRKEEEK